jgi:Bardet-Biedl syndrome 4 protein
MNGGGRRRRQGKGEVVPSPARLNWMIHLAYVQKDYVGCKSLVDHELKESNGNAEFALYVKGLLLRHEGKMEESLEYFQKAMHINPHHKDNAKQVARTLFLMSRHRGALAVYEQILTAGVRDWHILHNMGVCYSFTDQLELAEQCLEEALELHKHDVTYLQLGKVLLQQGKQEKAIKIYEVALTLSPENAELLTTLGLLQLEMGNTRKAFDLFGSALTYDPRDPKAVMGAGSIIQDFEDYDVALIKYRVTAVRTPESPEMWNNIGMCFFGKGKLVASIACLKKAVYLAPSQWKISYNLGLVHLHNKQYVSAFHFLSAAINFKKDHSLSFMLLGTALMYLDDPQNSRKAFAKALDLDSTNPLIYLNYGALLCNDGDMAGAAEQHRAYERCCAQHPKQVEKYGEDLRELSDKLLPAIMMGNLSDKAELEEPDVEETEDAEA